SHPDDVYVSKTALIADSGAFSKLTDHNPQVGGFALGRSEVIRWKSKDGKEIEGMLIYPVDYTPGKRYPTIALIHGGPSAGWTKRFRVSHRNSGLLWPGKGWVTFYSNVRGSSAYGEDFLRSNVGVWGGGDLQDIQSGIDYLVSRGIGDPDRLCQS